MKKSRVFGGSSTVLSTSYDPKWLCWKTLQTSFDWAEPMSLARLPKSGMTVNGRLYRLDNSVLPTSENDGLVLPIPCHRDYKNNPLTPSRHTGKHSRCLNTAVGEMLLPTPTVNGAQNSINNMSVWKRNSNLNAEAAKMVGLTMETATTGVPFQLNPPFVEEMMGFPIGWTELEHSETQSSHSAQNGLDNK